MAKLMTGDRGGKVLVLDNFRYHRHRNNQENIRWRCWSKNCRAVLRTNIFDVEEEDPNIIVHEVGEHLQYIPLTELRVHNADFRQAVTGELKREPTVPIRRVYNARRVALQRQRQLQGGGDREPPQGFLSVRPCGRGCRDLDWLLHSDDRLAAIIRKVMALGHLPLPVVQNNFDLLLHHRNTRRTQRDHPELQDFFLYVRNTYVHPGAAFPPAMWNVFQRNMEQRTNNHVECK
ncbi:unnamed protein product [Merluccius merluccius]